jgi:hypothetical protein
MEKNCPNYDGEYEACKQCRGAVYVTQPNGSVDRLCTASETEYIRNKVAQITRIELPTLVRA